MDQACSAHGPYCNLWPPPPYSISPHFLTICVLPRPTIFPHIISQSVACQALQYFPTLSHNMWPAPPCSISPHYLTICSLPRPTVFPHIISQSVICPPYRISSHYLTICGLPRPRVFPHIISQSVACPALQYFPTLSHNLFPVPPYSISIHYLTNGTIFEKMFTEHKRNVFVFCTTVV